MNEDIYDDNNSIDISHTDIILRPGSASSNRIRSVRFKQSIPNKLELRYDDESLELNNTQGRLNTFRKVCFGFGGLPYQLCANSIALYFAIFLLDVAKIRPGQVSAILFSARGWDAITDPLIGFLVNRTNSRFGKLRPWILFSTPFAILSYIMIWYVPPDFDRSLKTFWYLLFYCLFQTFLSCRHVPYTSLTMYLTPVQAERDSATSFRMGFEVLGVLLAAVIQGVMITIVNPTNNCDKSTLAAMKFTTSGSNYSTSPNIFYDGIDTTTKKHGSNNALADGYLITAGITGLIYLVSSFVVFFGTKEMNDVIVDKDLKFFSSLKAVFRHKSYITLLVTFLLNSLAVQLVQANLALFCKYSIDAGDQYQFIIIFLLLSGIISLPIWQILIPKYGKKSIYAFGLMLFIPLLFFLLYIEEPIWLMYISSLIGGLSIAVNFLLPWSMLPDVIDEFMIKTGERKESIFYSFYVFFTKLSAGLAVSASALVLEFAGYEDCLDGCCKQPESVGLTLRLLIVPAPVIMILGSLMFLWKHPIDEARRIEIKETLAILSFYFDSILLYYLAISINSNIILQKGTLIDHKHGILMNAFDYD